MLFTHLKQFALHPPISAMSNDLLPVLPTYVVYCPNIDYAIRLTSTVSLRINKRNFSFSSSFVVLHSSRSLHCKLGRGQSYVVTECSKRKSSAHDYNEQFLAAKAQTDEYYNSVDDINGEDDREIQRRRKIGLANKGKVPWNKGRKHSAETRAKIRQKTREALNDPKVRKKMSECPRSLSNQTKARIRSSLRNLWARRLKWKRSREKFMQSWAESVARAAKIGGTDQEELHWNSYDKMKTEIALQKLHRAAEKAQVKIMSRIRAERKAQATAEKMAILTQKRKVQEEKANTSSGTKRETNKKLKEEKGGLDVARELKLKARLTKIQKKKIMINPVSGQQQRNWEKLDLDFIKRDQLPQVVSLDDQIRLATNKRLEHAARRS